MAQTDARFRSQTNACEIAVEKMALEQVFLRVLLFVYISIILPILHIRLYLIRRTSRQRPETCKEAMLFWILTSTGHRRAVT